jgi:hypothetical protein
VGIQEVNSNKTSKGNGTVRPLPFLLFNAECTPPKILFEQIVKSLARKTATAYNELC